MPKSRGSAELIDSLARQLCDDIKYGRYDFGQRLRLAEIQERYRANQFQVRQALTQLKAMKLVEHRPNFGFRICDPGPLDRSDLRQVRVTLERSAVPLVIARTTKESTAILRRLARNFARTVESNDRQAQVTANISFHRALYKISGNHVLADLIDELRERSYYGTAGRWRTREGISGSAHEHFAMVDAIESRDPVELDRIVFVHIQSF